MKLVNKYEVNTFGGVVRANEFETNYGVKGGKRSYWADKIAGDFAFDRKCKRNIVLMSKKVS